MAGRRKPKPKHGPVKHITDPRELARLGAKYLEKLPGGAGAVECNGNSILFKIDVGAERIVTDHDIVELLKIDAGRPEAQKLSRKHRTALASFRRTLSQEGEKGFSEGQGRYLRNLIKMVDTPRKWEEMPSEEREDRNLRISAFFAFGKLRQKGDINSNNLEVRLLVGAFVGDEAISSAVQAASRMLEPYGLQEDAVEFVYLCAAARMITCSIDVMRDTTPKTRGKHLFGEVFNPSSRSSFDARFGLGQAMTLLGSELAEVPHHAEGIVREKMDYVVTATRISA